MSINESLSIKPFDPGDTFIDMAGEMLFPTYGMGTEHKPVSRPIER